MKGLPSSIDRLHWIREVGSNHRSIEFVIKERNINLEDSFRNRPDRQIAFKFSLEEAISTIKEVEWRVNGGTYTPVAIFD